MALTETEAYDRARDAYLAAHPAPEPSWFPCPRCKAEPETPCVGRVKPGGSHTSRQDLSLRAFRLRSLDAADHADGYTTHRHIKFMRRVKARPPITKEN